MALGPTYDVSAEHDPALHGGRHVAGGEGAQGGVHHHQAQEHQGRQT